MNSIEEIHLVTKELELVEAQITLAQRSSCCLYHQSRAYYQELSRKTSRLKSASGRTRSNNTCRLNRV